jgi:propanol-preferring alcohol dehydrogenase
MPDQQGFRLQHWATDPLLETFAQPEPRPGEVLVNVEACGIGLTVLNCIRGDLADELATLPVVPGHELVGRVVGLGQGADPALDGRLVAAYFYLSCWTCEECRAGRENRCPRLAGYVGVHRDGGYAQFAALPSRNLVPLPEGLDPVQATVIADAVATPVHVCASRAGVGPRDRVLVIGAGGGVGIHLVQVARVFGAEVAGMDVTEAKLAAIADLGARAIDGRDLESADPRAWGGLGPTVVVDLVGTADTLAWAGRSVAAGGRVVILTTFPGVVATYEPRALVGAESALVGSRYATWAEVRLAADLVATGRVRPMIGVTTGPEGLLEVHRRLATRSLVGRAALTWS